MAVNYSAFPLGVPPPLHHPAIGTLQGRYNKGAIQYFGIPYARLQHRFAAPELADYDGGPIDAQKHGPTVLLPAGSAEMEMSFIQDQLPASQPPMSDVTGLNINVTVPLYGGNHLPVLVYVHGGGFAFGSSTYPHYDQAKVVELSAIMGQPAVAVHFNYRLGIPGFLSSAALRAAGIADNRGLRDQRVALRWVQRYIGGFGGDPRLVTVVGQSAGAASINFMMLADEPLFHQAVLLGGSFLMMPPADPATAEQLYSAVVEPLCGNTPTVSPLQALLDVPAADLVAVTPALTALGPVVDGDLVPTAASFAGLRDLPGRHWCKRLYLLESEWDGSIFAQVGLASRTDIGQSFARAMRQRLGDGAPELLQYYGLCDAASDDDLLAVVRCITDVCFLAPALRLAAAWSGQGRTASVALLNERNPWPGPWQGRCSHLLDTALLWGNYNQRYPGASWTVGRPLAESVVAFASEADALPVWQEKEGTASQVTVFGPSTEGIASLVVGLDDPNARRDLGFLAVVEAAGGLDAVAGAMAGFIRS